MKAVSELQWVRWYIPDNLSDIPVALCKHFLTPVFVCLCVAVLCQLRCWLSAAYCVLLHGALLPCTALVRSDLLCQRKLPWAPPSWHPALPPRRLPAHNLLEGWPMEQGEREKSCSQNVLMPSALYGSANRSHLWICKRVFVYQCSQTCGAGVMERRVECVTSKGQPSKHCRPSERPESRAACQDRECEFSLLFSPV